MNTPVKTWLGVTIIIIMALSAGMFIWHSQKSQLPINQGNEISKKCPMMAKVCPDGSTVGITGPNCEFAPCSEIVGLEDKLIILSPSPNAQILNPVSISGKARGTWFFEGSLPVNIYDSNNKLLGRGYASFVPLHEGEEWMTEDFVNFEGNIEFESPTTDSGYILFKKDNPSDLRELDESYKLNVKLLKDEKPIPEVKYSSKAEECYWKFKSEMRNLTRPGMPNPASYFCGCMGGTSGAKPGTCKIDSKTYEQWEYFCKKNPYDNSISGCIKSHDEWVNFCNSHKDSVYCN